MPSRAGHLRPVEAELPIAKMARELRTPTPGQILLVGATILSTNTVAGLLVVTFGVGMAVEAALTRWHSGRA